MAIFQTQIEQKSTCAFFARVPSTRKRSYESIMHNLDVIISVIRRPDDIEGKLVVVPEGVSYSDEEILKEVAFQEQYFESVLLR